MPLRYIKLSHVPIEAAEVGWVIEVAGRPFEVARIAFDNDRKLYVFDLYPVYIVDGEEDWVDWNKPTPYRLAYPEAGHFSTVFTTRAAIGYGATSV